MPEPKEPKVKLYLKNTFLDEPCTVHYKHEKPGEQDEEGEIPHGEIPPPGPDNPIRFFEDDTLFIWAKLDDDSRGCGFKIPMKVEQEFSDFPLTIKLDFNNSKWEVKINSSAFKENETEPKNVNVNIGDKDQ
jgi:hypothetical protein